MFHGLLPAIDRHHNDDDDDDDNDNAEKELVQNRADEVVGCSINDDQQR